MATINVQGVHYRDLNTRIKEIVDQGEREITLDMVNGQRYLGEGIQKPVKLVINGTPGNDLAAFASNVEITINGNGQDGIGNTMGEGKIVVHGDVGDITGYAMRGGKIYIKGRAGYRLGIHMKGYQETQPVIIIGGSAGDFTGEYMAGGRLIILGLNLEKDEPLVGNHLGVGMHGGIIYLRGSVEEYKIGREVKITEADEADRLELKDLLAEYCREFQLELKEVLDSPFSKLSPVSSRPYGNLYAY